MNTRVAPSLEQEPTSDKHVEIQEGLSVPRRTCSNDDAVVTLRLPLPSVAQLQHSRHRLGPAVRASCLHAHAPTWSARAPTSLRPRRRLFSRAGCGRSRCRGTSGW